MLTSLKSLLLLLMLVQSGPAIEDLYKAAATDMDSKQWAGAAAKFEQVLKEQPTHIPTMFNLAVCNYELGNREPAIELYRRILQQDASVYEARVNLGLLLQETGDPDGAAEQFEAMVAAAPEDPEKHMKAASLYYSGKQFDRAYPHLVFAEKYGTPTMELFALLSSVEHEKGDETKSLEHMENAAELAPENAYVQEQLGIMYFEKKDYAKAVPVLERNVRRDPNDANDLYMLGKAYFETRRYPQAVTASLELLTLKPDSSDGYWTLGFAFYEQEDWTRASKAFLRYLELQPDQPVGHFLIAICLDKLGDLEEALVHYNKFLALDDGSSDTRSFQARERAKALDRRLKR